MPRSRKPTEWIGGLLRPPFFVTDRDEPYRPGLVIWMDANDDLVVGQDVVLPEECEGAVGRALRASMERPLEGPPRRPERVRIADAGLAEEVCAALGDATPIEIAPTPELDALLALMRDSMGNTDVEPESYLEGGRIPLATVAHLFAAGEVLYGLAPWKVAGDGHVLRMDIPALGVEGACVSIMGSLGQSFGLIIFPSLEGFDAFVEASEHFDSESACMDLGSDSLALEFVPGADLPDAMRREVAAYGWPVADENAYPQLSYRERDGLLRPLAARDVEIAAACASSLSAFFAKHPGLFEGGSVGQVCESWFDENDLEVRFTLPYEAFELFEVADAVEPRPATGPKVGRNQPCPCGSEKK